MALSPGVTLGGYQITALIGKGGMGEVWKALDTKLGREVAIKTLPEEFAQDEERLARFEREAKLLASLTRTVTPRLRMAGDSSSRSGQRTRSIRRSTSF